MTGALLARLAAGLPPRQARILLLVARYLQETRRACFTPGALEEYARRTGTLPEPGGIEELLDGLAEAGILETGEYTGRNGAPRKYYCLARRVREAIY